MPIMIMNAITSTYHAKIGILESFIPGARVLRMPTMSSTAAATAEISTKPSPRIQTSVLIPGEYLAPVRGGDMKQPPAGAPPKKRLAKTHTPPGGEEQKPRAQSRGEGKARGP